MTTASAPSLGVYVHIPFCAARCDYCAFATWTDRPHLIESYLEALVTDIERVFSAEPDLPAVTSVFFGGGTPSLVPADSLMRVLGAFALASDAEVTIECNPDTVTESTLQTYRAAGVNRLSFGVQSMVPEVLVSLGRSHSPENVERGVTWARAAGFESFNLDLIYGAKGESLSDWERTIDAALSLDPPHISAYGLTVESGTPLAADRSRHPDDDDQADKYLLAESRLSAAGLEWYEISNWARPGMSCRHNLLYWSQGDYLAFGCAAHGHRDGRRWWNVRTPERYIEAVERGLSPVAGDERLDHDARNLERLQLAVRTSHGVPRQSLRFEDDDTIDLTELVVASDDQAVLNLRGRLLANEVALRLQ